jgi:hypothetical protein
MASRSLPRIFVTTARAASASDGARHNRFLEFAVKLFMLGFQGSWGFEFHAFIVTTQPFQARDML